MVRLLGVPQDSYNSNIKDHWPQVTVTNTIRVKKFEILWELSKCDTKDMKWASAVGQWHLWNNSGLPQTFDLLKQTNTQKNTPNNNNNSISAKCNKMQCAYIEDAIGSPSICPPVLYFHVFDAPQRSPEGSSHGRVWLGATNCSITLSIQVPSSTAWKVLKKGFTEQRQFAPYF